MSATSVLAVGMAVWLAIGVVSATALGRGGHKRLHLDAGGHDPRSRRRPACPVASVSYWSADVSGPSRGGARVSSPSWSPATVIVGDDGPDYQPGSIASSGGQLGLIVANGPRCPVAVCRTWESFDVAAERQPGDRAQARR